MQQTINLYCPYIQKEVRWDYKFDWELGGENKHYYECESNLPECQKRACLHTTRGIMAVSIDEVIE